MQSLSPPSAASEMQLNIMNTQYEYDYEYELYVCIACLRRPFRLASAIGVLGL